MQEPWLEQVGSMHWPSSTLHSAPFHPARHTHLPFSYTPFPLHSTGHESAEQNRQIRAAHSQGRACKHSLLQYMSCETAVTHCERGYALLSQLGRRFSKSSSCLLALSLSLTHALSYAHTITRTYNWAYPLLFFNFLKHHLSLATTATQESKKIPPNVTSLPLNRPWKQSWKRKIRRESIWVYKKRVEISARSMHRWRAVCLM